jgi:hypothetical protein
MKHLFSIIAVACALGCAAMPPELKKVAQPQTLADAAKVAVKARKVADNTATYACLAYASGVMLGRVVPDPAAETACESLVEEELELPSAPPSDVPEPPKVETDKATVPV